MIQRFQNKIRIRPLDGETGDFDSLMIPLIWGAIVLAVVFIIIPAMVSIIFM